MNIYKAISSVAYAATHLLYSCKYDLVDILRSNYTDWLDINISCNAEKRWENRV